MIALLLAFAASAKNDVDRRDVSRAVRKELGRMYMMQTFLGPYAPYFMMFGGRGFPLFNMMNGMKLPMNMNLEDFAADEENADDANIDRKDLRHAVRRELQRLYMLQFMMSHMPQQDAHLPEGGRINPLLFPFLFNNKNQAQVNEDYDDEYDYNDYDDDYDYDYNDDYYYEE